MKNENILLFANPEFDKRCKGGISKLYQIFYLQYGYNLEIVNLEFLSKYIPEEQYSQLLVIAGGDGTINKVINTIPDEAFNRYIFGIIPTGTANEFAKSLFIPLKIKEAADLIMQPRKIYYHHLGIINGQNKFATGLMYGIASKVLQTTPVAAKHIMGFTAYHLSFFRLYTEYLQPWLGFIKKFKINSREFRTNYLLINNASLISKGIKFTDTNEENKNLFSLVYIHSRLKVLDILRIMIKHHMHYRILYDPALYYEQLSQINLEFEDELEFLLDGDPYTLCPPLNIEFFKHSIAIISG